MDAQVVVVLVVQVLLSSLVFPAVCVRCQAWSWTSLSVAPPSSPVVLPRRCCEQVGAASSSVSLGLSVSTTRGGTTLQVRTGKGYGITQNRRSCPGARRAGAKDGPSKRRPGPAPKPLPQGSGHRAGMA